MNGCGGESITVEVEATTNGEEDYDSLYVKAIKQVSEFLPGRAIQRRKQDCGNALGEEWYVGCAHSRVSTGGQKILGTFTFVRHGSEESW